MLHEITCTLDNQNYKTLLGNYMYDKRGGMLVIGQTCLVGIIKKKW